MGRQARHGRHFLKKLFGQNWGGVPSGSDAVAHSLVGAGAEAGGQFKH